MIEKALKMLRLVHSVQKILWRKSTTVTLIILLIGLCAPLATRPVRAVAFNIGDVFASVNFGKVQHYDAAGHLLETLDNGLGGYTMGLGFDSTSNLYVTCWATEATVYMFDNIGAPIGTFGTGYAAPSSIVFDAVGNVYVGQWSSGILKFDSTGNLIATYYPEGGMAPFIDLAFDQTTMFYAAEGRIKRFDVGTGTQLTDFANLAAGDLRILPDGTVLAICGQSIVRLNSDGNVIQTYDAPGEDGWYSLSLDPDGTSFWSGDPYTSNFYKFDIASGTVLLGPINTGTVYNPLLGLAVYGEERAAQARPRVRRAIDDGVSWLAMQQNPDGSWGSWYPLAQTGLAVLKLEEHAVDPKYGYGLPSPFDPTYPYRENVEKGLNFIFANAYVTDIDMEPAGNPDTNSNGKGIYFTSFNLRTYETGIAMMAIAGSRAPHRVVNVPGSAVDGRTYEDVLQDAVDYMAWGQTDEALGGWNYDETVDNAGPSDQSNTGWATFGLGFAESPAYGFLCTIPAFVKTELNNWIDYIQNDVDGDIDDGGAGYMDPNEWVNILKTGHLLYMMAFVGDTATTPRVQDAVAYLVRHWNDPNVDPGWKGAPVANYQAMLNAMKGLFTLGIHEINGIDWQTEFEYVLTGQQLDDGSWPVTVWDYAWPEDRILSTEWALLTLEKVAPPMLVYVDIKPGSWPNPINLESRGVMSLAICGTVDFDVTTIDVTTIKLTREGLNVGVSRIRWNYEDVATPWTGERGGGHALGGDGYLDLTLKFKSQEVRTTLDLDAFLNQKIPLIINGNLNEAAGGTPITGQDYVWIMSLPGDVNDDLLVSLADAGEISNHWSAAGLPYAEWADLDGNGIISLADAGIVGDNWGQSWQP